MLKVLKATDLNYTVEDLRGVGEEDDTWTLATNTIKNPTVVNDKLVLDLNDARILAARNDIFKAYFLTPSYNDSLYNMALTNLQELTALNAMMSEDINALNSVLKRKYKPIGKFIIIGIISGAITSMIFIPLVIRK